MESSHRNVIRVWAATGVILFIAGAFMPLITLRLRVFTGDESTYFAMALSIARDHDLVYEKKDLYRIFSYFPDGPQGIFLKKGKGDRLYFAKSYIYPLFAAPFVRLFGINGFVIVNLCLLWICMGLGIRWVHHHRWRTWWGFAFVVFFFVACVLPAYIVWFTPEVFNFAMVFIALMLWFTPRSTGRQASWLTDLLGLIAAALATVSKPPNIICFVVFGLYLLWHASWKRLIAATLIGGMLVFGLFGYYQHVTGDWNFQGGERKTFYGHFPLESPRATFDALGVYHSTSVNYRKEYYIDLKTVLLDIFYYFFGRYSGLLWYFTPAVLGLFQAFRRRDRIRFLALFGFFTTAFLFIMTQPNNYLGGGGTLGNRYFTSVYPWAFLMITSVPIISRWFLTALIAAIFSGPILTSPFMSARFPWMYAQTAIHRLLPLEYTLLENLPSNTLPRALHIEFPSPENADFFVYFLNDGFYPKERTGFWVRGGRNVQFVIKRKTPRIPMKITILNGAQPDHPVHLRVGKKSWSWHLKPRQSISVVIQNPGWMKIRNVWMLPVEVITEKGFIPAYVEKGSRDRRILGVYVDLAQT